MTFDNSITTAAIATLTSAIITLLLNYIVNLKSIKRKEYDEMYNELHQMIIFYVTYPYLENESFISSWEKSQGSTDEKKLRYEAYCIYVFNFLERLCKFYKYKKKKIENFINIKEIVRTHSKWWSHPDSNHSNIDGYEVKFRNFINEYIK